MRLRVNIDRKDEQIDLNQALKSSEIRYGDEYSKPEPLIRYVHEYKEYDYINHGGMSAVFGKQKSRKTFYLSLLMSCVVGNTLIDERLKGYSAGKNHLWFDTEQTKYYCSKIPYRVTSKIGVNKHPDNFKMYSIKRYTTEDRVKIIEDRINNTPNLGLVIIDGVRDIVKNFNDLEEMTDIINTMMNWSDTTNCHLCLALHINPVRKGDEEKPRGHLGTEIQNKVEASVIVEKSQVDQSLSLIRPRDFRDLDIGAFALCVDNYGIPYLIDYVDENKF